MSLIIYLGEMVKNSKIVGEYDQVSQIKKLKERIT